MCFQISKLNSTLKFCFVVFIIYSFEFKLFNLKSCAVATLDTRHRMIAVQTQKDSSAKILFLLGQGYGRKSCLQRLINLKLFKEQFLLSGYCKIPLRVILYTSSLFFCFSVSSFWGKHNSRTEANFFMKIYQTIAYILEGLKCKLQLIIFSFTPVVNKKGFLTALRDTPGLRDTKSNVYVWCAMNALYI